MYRVKISVHPNDKGINRQLPGNGTVWGDFQFFINESIGDADFWVVCFKDLSSESETCNVAPENTILITGEPEPIYHYSRKFVNQFGKVISCRGDIRHPNVVMDEPAIGWYNGRVGSHNDVVEYSHNYDDFKTIRPEKTKLISVISSNKCYTRGHRDRIQFVRKLKEHYGDRLDVFGKGFSGFDDKWDVVAPYKYHIALENCSFPYYWTEKLADSFLGNAFPFYYGCPNVGEYFDGNSFRTIDIHNPEEAIEIIDEAIANDYAEKYAAEVDVAKRKVLDEYNLFALIAKHIQNMDANAEKEKVTLYGDMHFFDIRKYFIILGRYISRIKYSIQSKI